MNGKRRIGLSIAIAIVSAAASLAGPVKTDYDRKADFSRYKTYSWGNVHTEDPLWAERIKGTVDAALAKKGWTKVASGGDISVMAMEMTDEHRTLNTYYDGFGGGWNWRWGGELGVATTVEEPYTVGTLVVDLFDTNTRMLVWRGSASGTLSSKSGKNIRILGKAVQRMFDHFPPATRRTLG